MNGVPTHKAKIENIMKHKKQKQNKNRNKQTKTLKTNPRKKQAG